MKKLAFKTVVIYSRENDWAVAHTLHNAVNPIYHANTRDEAIAFCDDLGLSYKFVNI